QCKGKESLLLDCDTSDRKHNTCLPGNAVGLTCSGKKQFVTQSTLLVGGGSRCAGGVESYYQREWRIVGAVKNQEDVAAVVCRQLGCGSTVSALPGNTTRGIEGQTWDKEFQCKGKESLLLDCDTSDRENNTCLPGNAVGLTCSEPDDVRLVGGGSRCAGVVEWYDQGEWRTVGAGDWDQRDVAAVVCRQMGCGSTLSVLPGNTTRGFGVTCYGPESSLRECFRSYDLLPGLTVICSAEYSVRLVGGTTSCSGTVEVFYRGEWLGLLCEADFDRQDAEVVCGELGCGAPAALQGGLYGEGEGQTWDKEFQCKGKESLLLDCDTSDRKHNTCLPGNAVGLTCSEPDDVRLVGGGSRCAGGVEWYDQGEWRTVGADDWNQGDIAAVVCRQLGCGSTVSVPPGNTTRGFRVSCSGSESSLRDCRRMYYPRPGLTVICSESVRLVDGAGLCSGRVEVKSNQSWASVCEADFDRQDAEVVCRDVGCGAPAALQGGLYGEGEGQTWDKEFQCKGKESLLLDCDTSDRENNTCLPGNAVGLTCSGKKQFVTQSTFEKIVRLLSLSFLFSEPDDVRLVGGGSRCAGGVEWYDQREWRTVGTYDWDDVAAVVCRQLGCGSTVSVLPGNTTRGFGVYCDGDESALRECSRRYDLLPGLTVICSVFYGTTNTCQPQSITAVRITESLSSSVLTTSVRLVDGAGLCSGRVEVKSNQSWASVCEADFDRQDAEVVCRDVGCGAPAALQGGLYGEGEGQTWDKEFQCKGKESLLLDCDTSDRKHNTCLPGNAVGLTCSGKKQFVTQSTLFLTWSSRCAGGVEWYDQGEWRSVGSVDKKHESVATVVCRQLGCGSTVSVLPGDTTRGNGVSCSGSESSLRECLTSYDLLPGLTVICSGNNKIHYMAKIRLVNGTTSCSGTAEAFYRGEWLSLCSSWWRMIGEVKVVCRQLDCGNPVAESRGGLIEEGRGGVMQISTCRGSESSIRQCGIRRGGPGVCDGKYYRHVICSVEVKSNQSWASVCEADFDRQDAEVVCRDVGCGAPAALQGGLYGEGEGQTWDKEFQCKGKESLLLDCDTSDRENNTCPPGNAVGLTCSGKKQFVTQSTLFLTWSEEYERQYRCVLVRK
uniref:SRCR domain-containing protein n=1 Tax=Oncorhynchus mykiss TaxID=8022 RepID=A0A8C7TU31_ONCMY